MGVSPYHTGSVVFVIRGGSWNNEPDNVRSANRNRNTPTKRNDNIGFRCAQDACPMARVRIFMGKVRSVPLGVQTDPGLVGSSAGQPKNAPPAFRTGQVTRSLVQGRPEVKVKSPPCPSRQRPFRMFR